MANLEGLPLGTPLAIFNTDTGLLMTGYATTGKPYLADGRRGLIPRGILSHRSTRSSTPRRRRQSAQSLYGEGHVRGDGRDARTEARARAADWRLRPAERRDAAVGGPRPPGPLRPPRPRRVARRRPREQTRGSNPPRRRSPRRVPVDQSRQAAKIRRKTDEIRHLKRDVESLHQELANAKSTIQCLLEAALHS